MSDRTGDIGRPKPSLAAYHTAWRTGQPLATSDLSQEDHNDVERRRGSPVLVLVHTVPPLVEEFSRLTADLLPGVRPLHVLDEPLLDHVRAHGPGPEDVDRLAGHIAAAEAVDAAVVLVTCSTISLSVDQVRPRFRVPIVKIDEAMAHAAVTSGHRIAIVATNRTTLEPSRTLLSAEAAAAGRAVELSVHVVDGALAALLGGDGDEHDRLVAAGIRHAAVGADVVVLAQASAARALRVLADPPAIPVLASPHLALEQVRRILQVNTGSRHDAAQLEVGS